MENDDDSGFRINTAYADNYNKWRQKEEYQKLKDKYGDVDINAEDSSDSESEDELAEGLTPQVEKDWLRTLSALKAKDPKIYDKNINFYNTKDSSDTDDDESKKKTKKKKKDKPVFLKDYERQVILEKGGKLSEDESDDGRDRDLPQAYTEEQRKIKASFHDVVGSDSDDEILTRRSKTVEEEEKDDEEYLGWLKGQKNELHTDKEAGVELEPLKKYWENPKLGEGERFLRDYILNKRYVEPDDEDRIPTYDEIVNEDEDLSGEEQEIEKQETFERKYNFRFEENDQEFIKSYPRTLKDSMRRQDDKRAKKREEVKERKEKEKGKKREEIKHLKNLKKKEICDKIELLKKVTGNASLGISEEDILEDFDPKKHDELMKKHFADSYYGAEEEQTKPVFSDDEDLELEEDWDQWTGYHGDDYQDYYEGDEGDDTYQPGHAEDEEEEKEDRSFGLDGTSKKKKKSKSKFEEALKKKKPVFDPSSKTFEEYFDEYYKLDCEDIIGDQPCRFKYRQVVPNDFGLSTDEILTARDKELNAWVSLKKMSQYRGEDEEQRDVFVYQQKSKNIMKKQRLLPSLHEKPDEDGGSRDNQSTSRKQRKKKKKIETATLASMNQELVKADNNEMSSGLKKVKNEKLNDNVEKAEVREKLETGGAPLLSKKTVDSSVDNVKSSDGKETTDGATGKRKRQRKGKKRPKDVKETISADRLKAYGINPKKFKYMQINKMAPNE